MPSGTLLPEEAAYRKSNSAYGHLTANHLAQDEDDYDEEEEDGYDEEDDDDGDDMPEEVVDQPPPQPSDEFSDEEEQERQERRHDERRRRRSSSRREENNADRRSSGGGDSGGGAGEGRCHQRALSAEEAALDLAELEALHGEAERMKGLGNRHMASQEYTRAYNAYSAALQLSPVGPSSHVYLSNRAAALLSMKKYSEAATDARRAVALAPSFGKAHARLGQALYFLKDYASAVAAYEEAVHHEPDNQVTWAYLAKAQAKLAKEEERRRRKERGEDVSLSTRESSMQGTVINSIATDPNKSAALVEGNVVARSNVVRAAAGPGGGGGGMARSPPAQSPPQLQGQGQGQLGRATEKSSLQAPPMEVRTGVMGPGGAQAKSPQEIAEAAAAAAEAKAAAAKAAATSPASGVASPRSQTSSVLSSPKSLDRNFGESYSQDGPNALSPLRNDGTEEGDDDDREDADFEEALRLHSRADRYLSAKQYRAAVEEYSAALFLVPDDVGLSPALHLGRAHALNGLKRHESATNDCRMALSLVPGNAEAYLVLGKSLFYAGDYGGSVEAFERGEECLRNAGEGPMSEFDRAYLEKAREFLAEEERNGDVDGGGGGNNNASLRKSRVGRGSVVPKLKPPRFVSREEILNSQQPISNRPMPKSWPQQSVRSPKSFHVGREKDVLFLSESMGIKLNRGPDGVVRVLSVTPVTPGSPILRKGEVEAGDVVREVHGVDLRRPITNVMWGDTVALIKLAPRPVRIVFAKELSDVPPAVAEEMAKASGGGAISPDKAPGGASSPGYDASPAYQGQYSPSPASGEEPVAESPAAAAEEDAAARSASGLSREEESDAAVDDDERASTASSEAKSEEEGGGGKKKKNRGSWRNKLKVSPRITRKQRGSSKGSSRADSSDDLDRERLPSEAELSLPSLPDEEPRTGGEAPSEGEVSLEEEESPSEEDGEAAAPSSEKKKSDEPAKKKRGSRGFLRLKLAGLSAEKLEEEGASSNPSETLSEGAAAPQAKNSDRGDAPSAPSEAKGSSEVPTTSDDGSPSEESPPPEGPSVEGNSVEGPSEEAPSEKEGPQDDAGVDADGGGKHAEETSDAEETPWLVSPSEEDADESSTPAPPPPPAASPTSSEAPTPKIMRQSSKQEKEVESLGGEILFAPGSSFANGWNNDKWLATSSERTLRHSGRVSRLLRGRFFWSGDEYVPRTLALYRDPNLILVLRPPKSADEVKKLLKSREGAVDAAGQVSEMELLHSFLVAESVVDPATCKLRLSQLTTATSIPEKGTQQQTAESDPRQRSCFELVTPKETLVFSAAVQTADEGAQGGEKISLYDDSDEAYNETSAWEVAVSRALFDVHRPIHEALSSSAGDGNFETDQAWKHQVVLGTLHHHALSGDVQVLKKALDAALRPPAEGQELTREDRSRILDGKDEFGLTALHYACGRRLSAVVNMLIAAGADSTIPTLLREKTPCHLSAEFLDEKSLSTILSASKPVRPDPNALDAEGRTPMYVASVEGKAVGGTGDSVALDRCISALKVWGGKMSLYDDNLSSDLPHPICVAATRWKSAELTVLFSHCKYLFPLDVAGGEGDSCTLGAFYHYPLHAACISLRKKISKVDGGAHEREFETVGAESPLVSTVRILLDHGFEPNERLEGVQFLGSGAGDLNDMFGLTPLQILAAASTELKRIVDANTDGATSSMALSGIMECLSDTAELLVKSGARISVDAPPTTRVKRSSSFDTKRRSSFTLPDINRSALKIDSNMDAMECLGGDEKLRSARVFWSSRKPVRATAKIVVHEDAAKQPISSSKAPGGNDANSCAICWVKFGKLMNRKHTCRVSRRFVCEACSSKRVIQGGKEFRVSDGQYRVAVAEAEKRGNEMEQKKSAREERKKQLLAKQSAHRNRYTGGSSQGSLENKQSGTAADTAKEELFSGASAMANTVKNFFMEEVEVPVEDKSADAQLQGVAATLSQTKDAFNERGERLNTLSEKTSALKDASHDFAKMAKQLNEQQKNSWW